MQKTLIIYESKYGTTEKIAKYLSLILGPAKYCKTSEFKDEFKDFDLIILGSPIYSGKIVAKIADFIEKNLNWLKTKKIALFCNGISTKDGNENLIKLEKILGNVITRRALGGILKHNKLDEEDSQALKEFSEKIGFTFDDTDNFNLEDIINYGLELKSLNDELIPLMPSLQLKNIIEEFLDSHNTCTLSTSYNERVRSTPIEYTYDNGFIYLISEGGEKFANLLLNNNVSLAVYEDYSGMNNLAGMQMTGNASLIEKNEKEYKDVLTMKGLNLNFINNMAVNMNIIKIKLSKIEFLYSKFKKLGYNGCNVFWNLHPFDYPAKISGSNNFLIRL
jgi:menaquinone-dependent protoporphyrinogen IX oxidase/uncharacterized protein YhbP (UPF0306 family)